MSTMRSCRIKLQRAGESPFYAYHPHEMGIAATRLTQLAMESTHWNTRTAGGTRKLHQTVGFLMALYPDHVVTTERVQS